MHGVLQPGASQRDKPARATLRGQRPSVLLNAQPDVAEPRFPPCGDFDGAP
jgi:hypothetical protein